jgi:integral membrane protein
VNAVDGSPPGLRGALLRYRVMAYAVGIGLIVLVLVGVPLKYAAGSPEVVEVVGPLHGALYIVYLLAAGDLFRRARWPIFQLAEVILAGLIPFLAFVVERRVTRRAEQQLVLGRTWP